MCELTHGMAGERHAICESALRARCHFCLYPAIIRPVDYYVSENFAAISDSGTGVKFSFGTISVKASENGFRHLI
jgi:hypothetical protein